MKLAFLLVTNNVITDEDTKKASFINIFTAINIPPESESVSHSFAVVGRISDINPGQNSVEVKIVDQKGDLLSSANLSGNIVTKDVEIVANFNLVKFSKKGRYYLKATVNGVDLDDGNRFYFDVI